MLCIEPVNLGSREVPCGTCPACRVNRRRDWTARLLLHEAGHVGVSAFVTLTYEDSQLPRDANGEGCLSPGDLRWFAQRLRRAVGSVRYCLVGEYGERTHRPHYHALLWADRGVDLEGAVRSAWNKGFVDVGEVSEASVVYTVSYLLKGFKGEKYDGFARFSAGLGTAALPELRRVARPDSDGVLQLPREFRLNGHVWPLPKYLRVKLEEEGYSFERRRDEVLEESFVQAVRQGARVAARAAVLEYRKSVGEDVAKRRSRARGRFRSGVAYRRKYETL